MSEVFFKLFINILFCISVPESKTIEVNQFKANFEMGTYT